MVDADRAVGRVDMLPARARRAIDVDLQLIVVDRDVDLLGLGQHRDGRGAGVDAPAAFGDRDALHPMHAALELQLRSEEHTSELQSLMRISYAVFCLKKKNNNNYTNHNSPLQKHHRE